VVYLCTSLFAIRHAGKSDLYFMLHYNFKSFDKPTFTYPSFQLPASTAGAVLFAGQVVEAIATPITGLESDRIQGCGNYGRRKSTHLFGTILTAIFFPFIFIELPGFDKATPEALLVYFIPVVFIFKFGWAAVQTTHLSMIPELASDPSDRDDLAILRY